MFTDKKISQCVDDLRRFYQENGRDLPWRHPERDGVFSAYKILVSEMMLQQTQVNRVIPKYRDFITKFPVITSLAQAPMADILSLWVGLGYNRRAKYLWEAAGRLQAIPEPWTEDQLVHLKGIGINTARAIVAYAYNQPVLFLETNIRTVLIKYYFEHEEGVSDISMNAKLDSLLHEARKFMSPREFYWALMDYGTYIKATEGNMSRRAKVYVKQSTFNGSARQLRGKIIRVLAEGPQEITKLRAIIDDDRFETACLALQQERLIQIQDSMIMLYNKA